MYKIPVFDSLTHPTIDSTWMHPDHFQSSGIGELLLQMDRNNISKALIVGVKGVGSYDEQKFINLIVPHSDKLIPIAFFDLDNKMNLKEAEEKLKKVKSLGYSGVKLHPRISGFSLNNSLLVPVIKFANEIQLNVLICTYFYGKFPVGFKNNIDELANLLYSLNGAKLILMHGGTVRLLEVIELVRLYKNLLLDLSFTLCKYKGSSVDLDIQFAFDNFDKRICVGSDFPEFTLDDLRQRFDYFSNNLSDEKAENIALNNITNFLKF